MFSLSNFFRIRSILRPTCSSVRSWSRWYFMWVVCRSIKSISHLFVICELVAPMWYMIFRWFEWTYVLPNESSMKFLGFSFIGRSVTIKDKLLWSSIMCVDYFWNPEKLLFFTCTSINVDDLVDKFFLFFSLQIVS